MIQTVIVIIIVILAALGLWRSLRSGRRESQSCTGCPLRENCAKKSPKNCDKSK